MLYPHLAELSDPSRFDQSVSGFLDHILKMNFAAFIEQASAQTGQQVIELERVANDGTLFSLTDEFVNAVDTLIVISFDSLRTGQQAAPPELSAVRHFLAKPGNLLIVSPHHNIGQEKGLSSADSQRHQEAEFFHHGDKTIPPRQGFGGFGRSLLAGLGVPVENRFGLRPAAESDGSPAQIEIEGGLDRSDFLAGVTTFNVHICLTSSVFTTPSRKWKYWPASASTRPRHRIPSSLTATGQPSMHYCNPRRESSLATSSSAMPPYGVPRPGAWTASARSGPTSFNGLR
jgi:hypothetical protein